MGEIKEYIKIAIRSLKTRPLRSWLTILGIVIGVFLVISLFSLSEGIKQAVLQQLKMMGEDLIIVSPGDALDITTMIGGLKLEEEDLEAIEKTDGVKYIASQDWKGEVVRYEEEKKTIIIYGNDWEEAKEVYTEHMGWDLKEGRWPKDGKREALIGSYVPEDVFPGIEVGDDIVINGKKLEVTGILKSLGNKQDDSMIGVSMSLFRDITGERKGAKMALAVVEEGFSTDNVVEDIKENLEENSKRRRGEEDSSSFTVLSSEKVTEIVDNIMGIIQAAIFGFASIAIVVGGIGIMNTMYTSVHERIREIGIMKAVGARRKTITNIFLIESGMVGLIGGVGGVFMGLILAKGIEIYFQVHPALYLQASITPQLVLFGLGFSFLVGCIAGYLPARSAAKLNPVEALRYE